jgi:hypothetical protein
MANVFPIRADQVVGDDMIRVFPIERTGACGGVPYDPLAQDPRDLAAAQGEHAVRLARSYLASARMSCTPPDRSAASYTRAQFLLIWAKEAANNSTASGRRLLNKELSRLKAELNAFRVARDAGAI